MRHLGASRVEVGFPALSEGRLLAAPSVTADAYEARRLREKESELFEDEAMWISLFKRGLPLSAKDLGKIQPVRCTN